MGSFAVTNVPVVVFVFPMDPFLPVAAQSLRRWFPVSCALQSLLDFPYYKPSEAKSSFGELRSGSVIIDKNGDEDVNPYHLQKHDENYEEKTTNDIMTILKIISSTA